MERPGDRRKNWRFNIPLDMEFVSLKGEIIYSPGKTRDFSREGLSFISGSVNSSPEEPIMIKFELLHDNTHIYALADIKWKRQLASKYLVGVKIRRIDQESRSKKLRFPFNIWADNKTNN